MKTLRLLDSFFLRRQSLNLILACVILSPLTSFAQQYQQTDLVSNAGQFGSGEILAFDVVTGRFQGKLRNQDDQVISIPGLWGIAFGAGNTNSGGANQLYFNAGINQGTGGLFGRLVPVASDLTQGNDQ